MRKFCVSFLCVAIFSFAACAAPTLRARTPVLIPDVPGYITTLSIYVESAYAYTARLV